MKSKENTTQKYLNVWAIILIIWSIYRSYFMLPEWFDEFIAKPLIFIYPVYLYIKREEKGNFFEGIWLNKKNFFIDLFIGIIIGIFFFSSAIVLKFAKTGDLTLNEVNVFGNFSNFLYIVIVALATGISEEILSRGFVLKRLYEDSKNIFSSSFFASILFFILHIPILFTNNKLTGNYLIFFMIIYLTLSLANSFIFILRKNIILPILIYTFYTLTITLYF